MTRSGIRRLCAWIDCGRRPQPCCWALAWQPDEPGEIHCAAPAINLQGASALDLAERLIQADIFRVISSLTSNVIAVHIGFGRRIEQPLGDFGELIGEGTIWHVVTLPRLSVQRDLFDGRKEPVGFRVLLF